MPPVTLSPGVRPAPPDRVGLLRPDSDADLTVPPTQMREWVLAALDRIIDHEVGLQHSQVIGDVSGRNLRDLLPADPSRGGEDPAQLLDLLFDELIPRSFNTASPGHFGWIPAGGVFPAAIADLVADAVNRYTGMYRASPALVQLEADVLRWFCDWFDFPPAARGVFTTGGSTATFSAVVCAREALVQEDLRRAVMYTSADAHLSVAKAARLAGLPARTLRRVPVDHRRRLRPDDLSAMIQHDRAEGLTPFMIVGTAGSTTVGAVDPLHDMADIADAEGLWLHVDAAYGGFFRLCPELRLLDGLTRADSITVDPHKSMFLPYGTGALLVREGEFLRRAHAETDSYLPAPPEAASAYDPSQYGASLSRDFPGLRVWLTIQTYGLDRLRSALQEKHDLARLAAAELGATGHLRLIAQPELSLFAFHVRLPGESLADENAATRELVDDVCAGGRSLLTGCQLDGREYARVCVLNFRTRRQHVMQMVDDVARAVDVIARRHSIQSASPCG